MKSIQTDNEFLEKTGSIIAARRQLMKIKSITLCRAVDISQSQLSRIENGQYAGLHATILNRLLTYLKIPWSDLPPPIYN